MLMLIVMVIMIVSRDSILVMQIVDIRTIITIQSQVITMLLDLYGIVFSTPASLTLEQV